MKKVSPIIRLFGLTASTLFASAVLLSTIQTCSAQGFTENMCSALDDRKDFAGLQNYCQQWMNQDPTNWTAVDYLGVSFYERQMYPQAIQCFRKAISLRPEIAFTYKQLALAEGYGGRFDHMLEVMHEGQRVASSTFNYQMWRWYGAWYEKWNDDDSAIAAWQHAYEMQPSPTAKLEVAQAWYHKGRVEAFKQQLDQSEADLKKAMSMGDPKAKDFLSVVQKYHYVDKPKWQAEADKNYRAWCAQQAKIAQTEPSPGNVNFGQLEFRRQTYQNAHPDTPYKSSSY